MKKLFFLLIVLAACHKKDNPVPAVITTSSPKADYITTYSKGKSTTYTHIRSANYLMAFNQLYLEMNTGNNTSVVDINNVPIDKIKTPFTISYNNPSDTFYTRVAITDSIKGTYEGYTNSRSVSGKITRFTITSVEQFRISGFFNGYVKKYTDNDSLVIDSARFSVQFSRQK